MNGGRRLFARELRNACGDARLERAMVAHEAGAEHPADDGDVEQGEQQRLARELIGDERLGRHHLDACPRKHARADVHEPGVALDEAQQHRASPDHDGDADEEPDRHQEEAAVRCASDRQHVVESHDGVGDHDRAQRAPECGRASPTVVTALALLGNQQLVCNPHEEQPAGEQQPRDLEQRDDHERQRGAHDDRAHGPPQDRALLQVLRHVAGRERDDDRVVARQHEVDHDDREQRGQELHRQYVHVRLPVS